MAGRPTTMHSALARLWGFLISRKVAIVLGLALLLLLVLGVFIPQAPADRHPAGPTPWWEEARARYGSRLDTYERLGLLRLYRTPTFLALAAALLLNTLACTIDRLGQLWRAATRRPPLRLPEGAYETVAEKEAGVSLPQLRRALRWRGYRVWTEADPPASPTEQESAETQPTANTHYLCAIRFPWAHLGTVLTHLGLFLLLTAILLQTGFAWRQWLVTTPEMPLSSVPYQTPWAGDLDLRETGYSLLDSELEIVRQGGILKDVRANLELRQWLPGGSFSRERTIGPGDPLPIGGATLFWYSYGLAMRVAAHDFDNQRVDILPWGELLYFPESYTEFSGEIPALGLDVSFIPSPAALAGALEEPITVRVAPSGEGETLLEETVVPPAVVELPAGQLELNSGIWLALELVHNPGVPWFIASGLSLAVGSALSLWFPSRRLWARLTAAGQLQLCFGGKVEPQRTDHGRALARALGPAPDRGGTP